MACAWRRHIVHELKRRDRNQSTRFMQLFTHYSRLLERTNGIRASLSCSQSYVHLLQNELHSLDIGQLACEVVELQHKLELKDRVLGEQLNRLCEAALRLQGALESRSELHGRAEMMHETNAALKCQYDSLLRRQEKAELALRQEVEHESRLLEQLIQSKREEAQRMNCHNSRRSRAREVKLQKLHSERSEVSADSVSAPVSRGPSPTAPPAPPVDQRTRSASASSPRILSSIRDLFTKRRVRSLSLEVDLFRPTAFCVSSGPPTCAQHVWEPQDEGVHCVSFSRCADVLATAGTDRRLKLWDVRNGSLSVGATLFGFTESVTCIDFDQTGFRVLASTSDKSALLWQLDDSVPRLTLSGHRRKVSAARFCSASPLVVTGSADGSIRLWDLHREACTHVVEVGSHCSDLVCSDSSVFSSHFDGRLRLWDLRSVTCVMELRCPDRVTCLDLSADSLMLLSCCRDDALHLFDLRGRGFNHTCLSAEGFVCGSDSNKAVISPDRGLAAGGSSDGTVYVWDVSSGRVQTRLTDQHNSSLCGVSWSISGRYLASVDKCRRAVLWSDT
uniref:Uncharacterized protein n=1 Tax=Neogobius melanostomus TaxID=47308 RepID=A0A8C6TXW9_9GOBI